VLSLTAACEKSITLNWHTIIEREIIYPANAVYSENTSEAQ